MHSGLHLSQKRKIFDLLAKFKRQFQHPTNLPRLVVIGFPILHFTIRLLVFYDILPLQCLIYCIRYE